MTVPLAQSWNELILLQVSDDQSEVIRPKYAEADVRTKYTLLVLAV